MATCPRCRGYLTDHHRCPRRGLIVAAEILLWGIAGAFAGFLLVALFDPHGQITDLDSIAAITGGLIGLALQRILRQ